MAVCVLCFCIMTCAAAVHAQKPPLQTKSPPAPAKTVVADPLGRDTPRGALIGFMKEAGSGNWVPTASAGPSSEHHGNY